MNDRNYLPSPSWETLAVEQYLGDYSFTKTPGQQRKILVAEFLDIESIPLEWAEDWDSHPEGIDPPRARTTEEVWTQFSDLTAATSFDGTQ
ncbi:unnamed protein product [Penicillium salamii]|uniref:Uncharacterized protein n=1 Tax=Penicillium salamii TaxID=1612424 RepID=A0A9W4J402_9EURO|nr:unnamed protein product [Penicillium salamii]